ncbi:uncharacterized protein METZ01_LOCUS468314, partial [marine metagenome]
MYQAKISAIVRMVIAAIYKRGDLYQCGSVEWFKFRIVFGCSLIPPRAIA